MSLRCVGASARLRGDEEILMTTTKKLSVACAVLFCAQMLVYAVSICESCGWEFADDMARFCSHCGAARGGGHTAQSDIKPDYGPDLNDFGSENVSAESGKQEEYIIETARAAAVDDAKLGFEAMDSQAYAYAVLALKNAAALSQIHPDVLSGKQRAKIYSGISKSLSQMTFGLRTCPVCGGEGKRDHSYAMMDGQYGVMSGALPCSVCNGAKVITSHIPVSVLAASAGDAKMRFSAKMQALARVPLASAWIPAELDGKFPFAVMHRIAKATAEPCRLCFGTRRSDCPECNGTGYIKCPNKDCSNGKITVLDSDSTKNIKRIESVHPNKPCPACRGVGWIRCSECTGTGACTCRECGGSGLRPECRSCHGTGLEEIRGVKRRGASQTMQLCKKCGGEGYSR